jgi:hypothetical protein
MANELEVLSQHPPISLAFSFLNPAQGATADGVFFSGGAGFVVPAGYKFHPIILHGESNADLTAGIATFKVTDDGTELVNGPEAGLADTVQAAVGVKEVGSQPIAAAAVVGVSITTDGSYAPATADLDAVLIGVLTPA